MFISDIIHFKTLFILNLNKIILSLYMIMDEIWITIKDFDNYQVSNLGRIKSAYKNKKIIVLDLRIQQ